MVASVGEPCCRDDVLLEESLGDVVLSKILDLRVVEVEEAVEVESNGETGADVVEEETVEKPGELLI